MSEEARLVLEAAQVEQQRLVGDAPDYRDRQATQGAGEPVSARPAPRAARRANGEAGTGQRLDRQRAGADLARAGHDFDCVPIRQRALRAAARAARAGIDIVAATRQDAQRRQALRRADQDRDRACSVASIAASRILSIRSARFMRIAVDARDEILATDDEAGLRTAEQLVARERHEIGTGRERVSATVGSRGRPKRDRSISVPEPRSSTSGTPRARARIARSRVDTSAREAFDAIVRRVHLEQRVRSWRRARPRSRAGAYGWSCRPRRASRPARLMISGIRNAPPISISSPRETISSTTLRERIEHDQHGGGVVVDDGGVLGARQLRTAGRARGRRARRAGPPRDRTRARRRCAWPRSRPRSPPRRAARGRDSCAGPCRSG